MTNGQKRRIALYVNVKKGSALPENYKDNFMEISKRRIALGDKVKISDIDILDDLKYAQAKADKLNIEIGSSRGLIGDKPKDADFYKNLRKRVDAKAFPKIEDTII